MKLHIDLCFIVKGVDTSYITVSWYMMCVLCVSLHGVSLYLRDV